MNGKQFRFLLQRQQELEVEQKRAREEILVKSRERAQAEHMMQDEELEEPVESEEEAKAASHISFATLSRGNEPSSAAAGAAGGSRASALAKKQEPSSDAAVCWALEFVDKTLPPLGEMNQTFTPFFTL